MIVDYDIHGLLGVRLVDPTPPLSGAAARQLNPLRPVKLAAPPDVSIAHPSGTLDRSRAYKLGDAGDGQECWFDESDFALVNGDAELRIPFDLIGGPCTIGCTPTSNMRKLFIEYVRPVLQMSLLAKGALAVHSAAVSYNGKGILLAGWSESGKTEAMMGFLQAGASFVSDKWTIVDTKGPSILHFPTPITVRHWMIDLIPGLRTRVKSRDRLRARAAGIAGSLLATGAASRRVPVLREAKGLADLGGRVSVTPSQLFGNSDGKESRWGMQPSAPLEHLFLLMTTGEDRITVRPAETAQVARRLAGCAAYERRAFLGLYQRYKYALPERRNPLIEEAGEREAELLAKALKGKQVHEVHVPFPFDPRALHEAISPYCE